MLRALETKSLPSITWPFLTALKPRGAGSVGSAGAAFYAYESIFTNRPTSWQGQAQ